MDVAVMDRLEDILSSCEYNGGGIKALLENVLLRYGSVVKSIQRGFAKATGNNPTTTITIEISEVNVDKCIVILNASNNGGSTAHNACITLKELNETNLVVQISNGNAGTIWVNYSWQVIEFY